VGVAADGTEAPLPVEEVATPGTDTIASLAALLEVPTSRTAKAAFFATGDGRLITAIVRGDFDVNETKLANAVKAVGGLRPATAEEIRAAGMEPGYGSPVGAHDTVVVLDALAAASPNLVGGANRPGFHLRNLNAGRDFAADVTIDIANAREGDPCPECGGTVRLVQGIEVGNIFKLGTDFTVALDATFLGEDASAITRSWVRTGSGSGARWHASWRRTTTRRGSPGHSRWRPTARTWWRLAPDATQPWLRPPTASTPA
jgi:prolyl-tRNA synthetase